MFSKIGTTLGVLDNKELRNLNAAEKSYVASIKDMNKEASRTAKDLVIWAGKENDSKDLEEYAKSIETLVTTLNGLYEAYSAKHEEYRSHYKSIIRREENMSPLSKRLDEAKKKVEDATKKRKPVDHLKREVDAAEKEVEGYEEELGAFKRSILKVAFETKFDALIELGSKIALVGTFGKFLASEIPQGSPPVGEKRPTYDPTPMKHTLSDLQTSISAWLPAIEASEPTATPFNTGAGAISPLKTASPTSSGASSPSLSKAGSQTFPDLADPATSPISTTPPPSFLSRTDSVIKTTVPPGHPVPGTEIVNPYTKPAEATHEKILDGVPVAPTPSVEEEDPVAATPA
ncbi:hypothetical protein M427DRAFT_55239 [Gonapodya prolifera JEL478]|uniref:Eisosome component PIL1-domain-containing protein n=1 Tax=Gonapodya prolifera (strain JEL478) TaxID=1344416 RepID=A0A139AJ35_GONPJ|nr:hypothetical protein M427DRAFT_55239 [Gonapodya prolifera JEL478]|eukprot:KXS16574.1 hypothetical protein M427DRAFT_55239 [Gonapodya prolifera JEL478]